MMKNRPHIIGVVSFFIKRIADSQTVLLLSSNEYYIYLSTVFLINVCFYTGKFYCELYLEASYRKIENARA